DGALCRPPCGGASGGVLTRTRFPERRTRGRDGRGPDCPGGFPSRRANEKNIMAGPRQAQLDAAPLPGARVLIVEARFYDEIADELLAGAEAAIAAAGAESHLITVPG